MVVEKGYKQTEVGIIPEDWECKNLTQFLQLINGRAYKQEELLNSGKYEVLRVGNFFTNNKWYFSNLELQPQFYVEKGDLMYAWSASFGPRFWEGRKCIYHYHIWKIVPKKNVNKYFLYHLLDFDKSKLLSQAQGGTMFHITKFGMESRLFPFPHLKEQTAIASALTDMDQLIAQTEKLIEKKKAIKQGVMQELLKPKEGWETKRLGDFGKCLRGVSYNPEQDLNRFPNEHTYSLLRSNNIFEGLLDFQNLQFVNRTKVKSYQIIKESDIVLCMANGSKQLVGKAAIAENIEYDRFTFGAFMGCFRAFPGVNSNFIFALFESKKYRDTIDILLSGSSINNLNPGNIESIEFEFPDSSTQNHIATIHNELKMEILVLERKLKKLKLQKQGMMQALLTGKIRLI